VKALFADLDETLKQLLIREVPLPPGDADIAFERPDREQTARFSRPTVDLFLFSIDENLDLIESGWNVTRHPDNSTTLRWPELRVDLRYLVTVWTQAIDDEHNLLFHLYRTFRRFAELPNDILQGAMARQSRPIPLSVERSEVSTLMEVWKALENTVRPALLLKATVAVDLNDVRTLPAVRSSGLRIGPMGGPLEARFDIAGRVRNEEGDPVAGVSVRAGSRTVPAVTDAQGRYRLASLPEAPVEIFASADGFQAQSRTVALPGDYDFTLSLAGSEADPTTEDRPRSRRGRGGRP
jgi:hypothetical protein